jgi:hypothetical protein
MILMLPLMRVDGMIVPIFQANRVSIRVIFEKEVGWFEWTVESLYMNSPQIRIGIWGLKIAQS